MKRLAITISAVAGLVLGLLIGAGIGTTVGDNTDAPVVAVQASEPGAPAGATWTFQGELAHAELPLEFVATREEVETDFGYQTDFTSDQGTLTIETAPLLAETTLTLAEVADRFAAANGGTVERRRVGEVETYVVTWTKANQPSSQYFFTKDEMTYGLRSNAGSRDEQSALLGSLVESLTRNQRPDSPAKPTPTVAPTPETGPEAPDGCIGDGATPMAITNVKKYANARDQASPDANIVDRVPLGTAVTFTGEKLKNGRFTWHEVYYPDVDQCVWIAHTLLEPSAAPKASAPRSTDAVVFDPDSIAGLPIGSSTDLVVDKLTELLGPPAGPFSQPPDSFWGPFRVGCFSFVSWNELDVSLCDDGTTAGWLLRTDAPANIELDAGTRNSVAHWRKLGNWPDDTVAYFRLDLNRWAVASESLEITGISSLDTEQPIERNSDSTIAVPASDALPSSTIIDEIWNLDYGS